MPFQSEKQRRYLHANHPEIANRWEAKYGLGGIADLNDLPEYYIPKNQGGRIGFDNGTEIPENFLEDLKRKNYYKLLEEYRRWKEDYERRKDLGPTQEAAHGGLIPSHEAGIYGLAEGGITDIGFSKVKPSQDGSRPGYFTAKYGGGDKSSSDSSASTGGNGYQSVHDTGAVSQTPGRTTPTTDDKGDGPINIHDDTIEVIEEQKKTDEINRQNALRQMVRDQSEKTETWEKAQQWQKPNKFVSFIKNAALAIIPGLLPAKMATAWKFGQGVVNYQKGNYDKYLPTDFKSDGKFATHITNTVKENAEKMKTHQKKMDLYKALPEGHPERIALQAELEIGKTTTPDGPNGPDGVTQETSITMDVEKVNDTKTQLLRKYQEMNDASRLAWQRQQMDRDKQMAYWRMMMEPYMAAEGGRIPGYNTGGLSNLFRLKNV